MVAVHQDHPLAKKDSVGVDDIIGEKFIALQKGFPFRTQMDQLCEEKKLTMLLVTHQPKEIERHIDRVIEIHQGKVI